MNDFLLSRREILAAGTSLAALSAAACTTTGGVVTNPGRANAPLPPFDTMRDYVAALEANGQPARQRSADDLSPVTFEKLHALIKPDPKVSFERIPWTTSLWGARQKAAAEDKPIVLGSGDPLPLGVT